MPPKGTDSIQTGLAPLATRETYKAASSEARALARKTLASVLELADRHPGECESADLREGWFKSVVLALQRTEEDLASGRHRQDVRDKNMADHVLELGARFPKHKALFFGRNSHVSRLASGGFSEHRLPSGKGSGPSLFVGGRFLQLRRGSRERRGRQEGSVRF